MRVSHRVSDGQPRSSRADDAAIAHFVERVANGGTFETSPTDNLKTLAIVEAIYEAAAESSNRKGKTN